MAGENPIYILYSYYMGEDSSTAVGWSESEDELKELKTQLEKKPKCPYGKKKRRKIDGILAEWEELEERFISDSEASCPYYDETKIPHITDIKLYSEWCEVRDKLLEVKRAEWIEENFPGITTRDELAAYDDFLERENDYTGYYITKLNHV